MLRNSQLWLSSTRRQRWTGRRHRGKRAPLMNRQAAAEWRDALTCAYIGSSVAVLLHLLGDEVQPDEAHGLWAEALIALGSAIAVLDVLAVRGPVRPPVRGRGSR